ncbi:DUF5677 domain-containing protein [Amycolatopsis alba]|uniref:DUF5677 domain-containing protein n=1 Tax=Amycolatopsis alba TaxID=76020 RepID=UPI0011781EAB|nr:DUF5677 domain-containing protein [Amycolatopsis alba]
MRKFLSVFGLVAHTYRIGEQALVMYESSLVIETFPLLRATYESALTAHWVAQSSDGAEALLNKDVQGRKAAATTLAKARSAILRSGSQQFPGADAEFLKTSSGNQARNFEKLCEDLELAGADAYAYYRLMSWYTHPTARLIDLYIEPSDDLTEVESLRQVPEQMDANMWVHFLAYSLIWAGRAIDFIDEEHLHRSRIRELARLLHIPDALNLSPEAIRRSGRAAREERRANWKGPRKAR